MNLKFLRILVLALSALVGIALATQIGDRDNGPDAATYIRNSEAFSSLSALLDGEAFDRNYWPAGYSGFLRLFAGLGDYWLPGVRVAQVLMVVSMAYMAYLLTKQFSERVGSLTLVIVAASPSLMWFALVIGYEVPLGWLLALAITLVWGLPNRRYPNLTAAIAGLISGLALIVQFKTIVILPVLIYLAIKSRHSAVAWLLVGSSAPVGAWMLRNYIALNNLAPWSNNGSVNIWLGNRPDSSGGYPVYERVQFPSSDRYLTEALAFASEAVRPFLELQVRKALRFWYPNVPVDFHLNLPTALDWLVVLFLFIYAFLILVLFVLFLSSVLWRIKSNLTSLLPLAIVVLLMFSVNMPFIVDPRYRIPVEALLLAICVPTLAELVQRWNSRSRGDGSVTLPG